MKCIDVQNALWSGKKSEEVLQHIETCFACQRESAEIQEIIGNLREIEIPAPSRSLVPGAAVIRETVKKNRRRPIRRISTIATAATVLLAVATGIGVSNMHTANRPVEPNRSQTVSPKSADSNTPAITVRNNLGNHTDMMNAVKDYLAKKTSSKDIQSIEIIDVIPNPLAKGPNVAGLAIMKVQLQPGVSSVGFLEGYQEKEVEFAKNPNGKWTVSGFDRLEPPTIMKSIQSYLDRTKPKGVKSIKFVNFTPDPQQDSKVLTGQVTLEVDLDPGAASPYNPGPNLRFVLLTNSQGVWDVSQLASSPMSVTDAPANSQSFEYKAQILQGTILDTKIRTDVIDGKQVRTLESIAMNVEKNMTTSNNTPQGPLTIYYEKNLQGINFNPQKGDHVIVFAAISDPRTSAGIEMWTGDLQYYFYQKDGQYHDLIGNISDPQQVYKKIRTK